MKEGSEIRNNVSESDGTVYVIGNGGYFEMAGGTIRGNTVAGNGGGLYEFGGGSARMTGGTISAVYYTHLNGDDGICLPGYRNRNDRAVPEIYF